MYIKIKRLFAIGDSHGCYDQLNELIRVKIDITKDDKIVLLGDYIDRGPDSKGVLDLIMSLINEGFDIIPLMGNHENLMLLAWENQLNIMSWSINGGDMTLQSFGISSVSELEEKYLNFVRSLPKFHLDGQFIFVHAGFNDSIEDPFTDEHSMIWERRFEYTSPVFKDKIIVHGHRPHSLEDLKQDLKTFPRVINIDTGCVYGWQSGYGHLSALELNTMELLYV